MSVSVQIVTGPAVPFGRAETVSGAGAAVIFEGIVRPDESGRRISGLRYEVYRPMAEKCLQRLCEQAARQFGLSAAELVHSEGFVPAGGVSLWIRLLSPHRAEALRAMGWLIDEIKKEVPIWKRPVLGE